MRSTTVGLGCVLAASLACSGLPVGSSIAPVTAPEPPAVEPAPEAPTPAPTGPIAGVLLEERRAPTPREGMTVVLRTHLDSGVAWELVQIVGKTSKEQGRVAAKACPPS